MYTHAYVPTNTHVLHAHIHTHKYESFSSYLIIITHTVRMSETEIPIPTPQTFLHIQTSLLSQSGYIFYETIRKSARITQVQAGQCLHTVL